MIWPLLIAALAARLIARNVPATQARVRRDDVIAETAVGSSVTTKRVGIASLGMFWPSGAQLCNFNGLAVPTVGMLHAIFSKWADRKVWPTYGSTSNSKFPNKKFPTLKGFSRPCGTGHAYRLPGRTHRVHQTPQTPQSISDCLAGI